jgi:hypothetical protein
MKNLITISKQDFIDNYIAENININSSIDLGVQERRIVTFCGNVNMFCRISEIEKPEFMNISLPSELTECVVAWIKSAREDTPDFG